MNQKELKRLSRGDLLEMMLSLSRENERLEKELNQAKSQLESRMLQVEESGSLAEAVLSLNGVFQATQAACDQYSLNIRSQADQVLAQANAQAESILAQAREEAKKIREEAARERATRDQKYAWIADLMGNSEET